ncbi:MAG TPA: hypothetical protein DDW86_01365 [Clostridiales bacterium]|nr:hypothetical protein [Clostridiales bacterium]
MSNGKGNAATRRLPEIWKAGIKLAFLSGLCYCLSGSRFDFPQDMVLIDAAKVSFVILRQYGFLRRNP